MPERKYMLHSSGIFFGEIPKQASLKQTLGGNLGNRYKAVKKFRKAKKKCKMESKALEKKKKCYIAWLFSPALVGISRRARRITICTDHHHHTPLILLNKCLKYAAKILVHFLPPQISVQVGSIPHASSIGMTIRSQVGDLTPSIFYDKNPFLPSHLVQHITSKGG